MLVDTGAAFLLVLNEIMPFQNWIPRMWKTLEGFNGADSQIGLTDQKKF